MLDFAPAVAHIALAEGLTKEAVSAMVVKSALVKHSRGNRRFHEWVFNVAKQGDGLVVTRMSRLTSPPFYVKTENYPVMFEVCPACDGDSCKECGWTGELEVVYQP